MADIIAETERLVLRRELPGDLEVWLEHMNTPEVMKMVGGVQSPEAVAESFAKMAAAADGLLSFCFLALKVEGTLIGKCGLSRIETAVAPDELRGAVQAGWTLRADCWGRGYAREAAEAAAAAGAGEREALVLETLMAFKRAGCSGVLTYHAPLAARLLNG